ncbi:MAG: glycosyltransferase family 2 protein [Bryobacterales bacterium]|nr:glycosyltransferase family 2 protein [Bryobacterales bacterium]
MKGIGAIIVTYNSEAEIGPCLDAARTRVERVVVVDNASPDGTVREAGKRPDVQIIANRENRGFAAAANQGMEALETPFLLLLNPDAELQTDVGMLAEACAPQDVGAAAGRLVDAAGRPQTGFSLRCFPTPAALAFEVLGINRLWRRNPVNKRYRCLDLDAEMAADVEQPAGAFLMIRREVWRELGGFDERFHPLWFEDVDFLKRLRDAGYRVRYVPASVARHRGGHSVDKLDPERRAEWWYRSLLRYSFKHFHAAGRLAVGVAVLAGCGVRMAGAAVRGWKRSPLGVYGRVIWFACLRLRAGRDGERGTVPALARQ